MKNSLLLFLIVVFTPVQAAEIGELSVDEIAPGLFVHFGDHQIPTPENHGAIANIGFIIGNNCIAVIDSGGNPQQGLALKKAIRKKSSLPICYVINSHVHPDHVFGNSAFKGPGVKFVGHSKLARAMQLRAAFYLARAEEQIGVQLKPSDIVLPDMQVKDKLELDLGDRKLVLTAHPTAHTDNDLSVYDGNTDTLWLSDLLFLQHLPVVDGSLKGWLKVLEQLEQRSVKIVVPGHGPIVTDWPKGMQTQKDYLQMLLDEVRMMISEGKTIEQAIATVGQQAKGQWRLFDQFHRKNVTTAFAELEWED